MKSYRNVVSLVLGLFFALSVVSSFAGVMCPTCKRAVPSWTKPVVAMLLADAKCSSCGMDMKSGSNANEVTCAADNTEINLCDMCAKSLEVAPAV